MKDITFHCTLCGQRIVGDESFHGNAFTCPSCNARVAVPHPSVEGVAGTAETTEPPELDILALRPTWRAQAGPLAASVVTAVAALVLAIVLCSHQWNRWWQVVPAVIVLPAVWLAVRAWLKTRAARYQLTSHRLVAVSGLVLKRIREIDLGSIREVTARQSLLGRVLECGDVSVVVADSEPPRVMLAGIKDPQTVRQVIKECSRTARENAGVRVSNC